MCTQEIRFGLLHNLSDIIRMRFAVATDPESPPDSVSAGEGSASLEPIVDAPKPTSLTPPQAFRCENCGATFQDEGALVEHLQHCPARVAETKSPTN